MAIKCGNCKEYHENVAGVRACHGLDSDPLAGLDRMQDMNGDPIDDDPFAFAEEEDDSAIRKSPHSMVPKEQPRVYLNVPFKDKEAAKKAFNARWGANKRSWYIDQGIFDLYERDIPDHWKAKDPGVEPISEDGVYQFFGDTYRIQWNREETRLYGKRLVIEDGVVDLVYEPGVTKSIAGARKLSLEEAQEFGKLYGECIRCGARLTDETSIANGIGPICKEKF